MVKAGGQKWRILYCQRINNFSRQKNQINTIISPLVFLVKLNSANSEECKRLQSNNLFCPFIVSKSG